jgi:hypothetical protein
MVTYRKNSTGIQLLKQNIASLCEGLDASRAPLEKSLEDRGEETQRQKWVRRGEAKQ